MLRGKYAIIEQMIVTLTGTVTEKSADLAVIDVNGVGYGVLVTAEDHGRLATGEQVKLYIYEHIRENSYELFGFCAINSKKLFEQLLDVNGVGPKMALNILSLGTVDNVRSAIAGGQTKFIQGASGVGKRVAERVVVELKDKVGLEAADVAAGGLFTSDNSMTGDEAVQALMALGYSPQDAVSALRGVETTLPTEERVKQALKARA